MSLIEVEEVTKRYGTHVAVDDVGFTVMEGEIFGILGVNGAGNDRRVPAEVSAEARALLARYVDAVERDDLTSLVTLVRVTP